MSSFGGVPLLLCIGLCLIGCKPKSATEYYRVDCYVRFNATEANLQAEVTAKNTRTGASTGLVGGATYQGKTMTLVDVQGIRYRYERNGTLEKQHQFGWKDGTGTDQNWILPLPTLAQYTFASKEASLNEPLSFSWADEPVGPGELLIFMWENTTSHQTVPLNVAPPIGMQQVEIPASQLKGLSPGRWTVYAVRRKVFQAKLNQTEVTGLAEYYSRADTLSLHP